ncbi:hypothetical protein PHLCEN_2v4105 [Hermanssonia centrifuga]|uniref:DUF7514 domain-containing protein n=1 Tax=Hermanssonia centrifuga TaxID=98765 RepID=A0A2R6Q2B3_9APHY|nr:hypothetical protein PHLCEN_2v4105 [Hermanssonia centrifuga]
MADALFFYLDQNCSVPVLRGTGFIEPAKYVWMEMMTGATQEAAQIVEAFLESYYRMANIPYRVVVSQSGEQIPVLDRKAWLHLHVFDAKSDPDQGHKDFLNYIRLFNLKDPLTNQPFPTPLPRSSFPLLADQTLRANVENWKVQAITAIAQARKQAEQAQVNEMIANMTRRPVYSFNPSLASFGAAGMGAGGYTGASFAQGGANPGGGGGDDNHANVMDVISGGLTLTNTILGSMGGGGFGGSGVGAGLLSGMFGAGF